MAKITSDFRRSALRRGIVVKTNRNTDTPAHLVNAAVIELANLGYLVNPDDLSGMSTTALTDLLGDARNVIGADRNWTPIYPGFPQQVEALDTLTLLVEQILHYWTAGMFLPDYPTIVREGLPLEDMLRNARKVKVLSAADTARELTRVLVTSGVAMSDDDKTLLKGALELQHPTTEEVVSVVRDSRHGENIQTFLRSSIEVVPGKREELFSAVAQVSKNTDQLLRAVLATYSMPAGKWVENYTRATENLSDKDHRAVRMARMPRASRRTVANNVGRLSGGFFADRLVSRSNLWRGVMRAVHPYDFSLSVAEKRAMDIIHSNVEYQTLNSSVESAMESRDLVTVVDLLADNRPGELLTRLVAILRISRNLGDARYLGDHVKSVGGNAALTTLISAYNGVLSANSEHARVNRVAGHNNTMLDRSSVRKVKESHLKIVLEAVLEAISVKLSTLPAPEGAVAVNSTVPVPLVRRDAATSDRVIDRGETFSVAGEGDVLRIFGHWNNDKHTSGYMDIGAVVLDGEFNSLAVSTWDTWSANRDWSTYSGDKLVYPGDDAAEYFDVKLAKLRKRYPSAKWVAMTVQSYSGWAINTVDFIAGAMLRSDAEKGEVFDARTVATAFKPTTSSLQAVPLAVNLETGEMTWIDSSSGSTLSGLSSSRDTTVGPIVRDELGRERFTLGQLASVWATVHGAETVEEPVDRDLIVSLLN